MLPRQISTPFILIALLTACDTSGDKVDRSELSEASTPAAPGGAPPSVIRPGDIDPQAFVTREGQANLYAVAAARIALERTRSNEVRDFANRLLTDHQSAEKALAAAAAADGATFVVPAALSDLQEAAIDALREAPDFDAQYLQQLRRAHEENLGALRRFAEEGRNPALRSYASSAAKTLEGHRATMRTFEAAATRGDEAGRAAR